MMPRNQLIFDKSNSIRSRTEERKNHSHIVHVIPIVLVPWSRFSLCHTPIRSFSAFWYQISILIMGCVTTWSRGLYLVWTKKPIELSYIGFGKYLRTRLKSSLNRTGSNSVFYHKTRKPNPVRDGLFLNGLTLNWALKFSCWVYFVGFSN